MNRSNILLSVFLLCGCAGSQTPFNTDTEIRYCIAQADKTLSQATDFRHNASSIDNDQTAWRWVSPSAWTSGFWPGVLWYLYEYSGDTKYLAAADSFSRAVIPVVTGHAGNHDVGFIAYCSLGNGYRLTGNADYKQAMLQAADSLATLYNPAVGTILSWPDMVMKMNWPHNTIIDNMMNLELLFWAARNGGCSSLYDIAFRHAETTMKNHFRPDYSTYHVAVYDTLTGSFIKGVTHQGFADETMWARGQAWAIYGFTMAYRETGDPRFLTTARRATDIFLSRLPDNDMIPYWDFDAPNIPGEPRDASAAAIVASALIELAEFNAANTSGNKNYLSAARKILASLSSETYQSRTKNPAFLLHSTGHYPNNSEIDASIIYADYYYLEALMRLRNHSY
jgi:unsaturated chondroitin disaccharide hydrolase